MTTTEQIKACAELKGIVCKPNPAWGFCIYEGGIGITCACSTEQWAWEEYCETHKKYWDSYDAIIPLIQKICKNRATYSKFADQLVYNSVADLLGETPAQLVEALLRACGKWNK